eukprot:g46273.t1
MGLKSNQNFKSSPFKQSKKGIQTNSLDIQDHLLQATECKYGLASNKLAQVLVALDCHTQHSLTVIPDIRGHWEDFPETDLIVGHRVTGRGHGVELWLNSGQIEIEHWQLLEKDLRLGPLLEQEQYIVMEAVHLTEECIIRAHHLGGGSTRRTKMDSQVME